MTHFPTSTAGINIAVTPCQVGAGDEPGVLLALCLGQQPKLSARLKEAEWEAIKRAVDAVMYTARRVRSRPTWYGEAGK